MQAEPNSPSNFFLFLKLKFTDLGKGTKTSKPGVNHIPGALLQITLKKFNLLATSAQLFTNTSCLALYNLIKAYAPYSSSPALLLMFGPFPCLESEYSFTLLLEFVNSFTNRHTNKYDNPFTHYSLISYGLNNIRGFFFTNCKHQINNFALFLSLTVL